MSVQLAKSAGFCFGVNRAVETVEKEAGEGRVCTLGPIIHNRHVVSRFESMGMVTLFGHDFYGSQVLQGS